jgi:hypothetical protein
MIYKINSQDEIVFVSDDWNAFAADNDGEAVLSPLVLGQPLWRFITDATTRKLYQQVLVRARAGHPIQFTYRCDSPTHRRLMEMVVTQHDDGLVEFATRTLLDEVRPAVAARREPRPPRSGARVWLVHKVSVNDSGRKSRRHRSTGQLDRSPCRSSPTASVKSATKRCCQRLAE